VDIIIVEAVEIFDKNMFDQLRVAQHNCRLPQFVKAAKPSKS
jgi:hypothetical protein